MYKWIGCLMLLILPILSGCVDSASYKDDDIAAIVRGEEIAVGDLRILYTDNVIAEMVDELVKAKLAEQEVKKMNIDVSEYIEEAEGSFAEYPEGEINNAEEQSIHTFAEAQAKELGMDPREYYKKYTETSIEMAAYVNAYTSEVLGDLEDDEYGIEEYVHHANELLDNLVEQNKDDIQILIE
ncbi:hypothetical protein M3210_14730 [Oceanobacillus luteolus]|uniref:Lipoprotein n=1 Tax=Oceanobacillus luteolus TaxID=1274358 RepID=A0ABW4HMQ0_9BACI|nr:hypothetical protein [Oceanobacillus luteolus]MCM3741526.1 hypothetical protein [Oceanobacillus luteolus]